MGGLKLLPLGTAVVGVALILCTYVSRPYIGGPLTSAGSAVNRLPVLAWFTSEVRGGWCGPGERNALGVKYPPNVRR